MMRSRLEKYVLYYHRGFSEDVGFTASFKPLLIEFARAKDAALIKEGWYLVKKVPNKPNLLIEVGDLEPLGERDLMHLAMRMRARFFKLVSNNVKSSRISVVEPDKIPVESVVLLLKLRSTGKLEIAKMLGYHVLSEVRGYDKALISRNGGLTLVVVADEKRR